MKSVMIWTIILVVACVSCEKKGPDPGQDSRSEALSDETKPAQNAPRDAAVTIDLRKNVSVSEPCLGNTPQELQKKCGAPEETGTFLYGGTPHAYAIHFFRSYKIIALFHEGVAHSITYIKGTPVSSSGMVQIGPISDTDKKEVRRLAEVNLKGDEQVIEKDEVTHIVYRGKASGISVSTMPLMSSVIIASTETGDNLTIAFGEETKKQSGN